ncbi:hypothetical protein CPAR01_10984 [Colletotrichum paranaense]|uniref:Uncharacterized protein n=1 Tax=Colletotrichum paranaense TaxID=1914294 RepID=A0ABQ9SAB9_9PEZI|nr:uncharacterized protein CPAR01_10984 [Colletotrichum paranaense]KAK1531335.1 hypothetical protein CPAR01_10984 [Colletotrichum paranaense]
MPYGAHYQLLAVWSSPSEPQKIGQDGMDGLEREEERQGFPYGWREARPPPEATQ